MTVIEPSETSALLSPVSTSVSLASTLNDLVSFSPAVPVSANATGASFTLSTVRSNVLDAVVPAASVAVIVIV